MSWFILIEDKSQWIEDSIEGGSEEEGKKIIVGKRGRLSVFWRVSNIEIQTNDQ